MPDTLTHYFFAEDMLKKINDDNLTNIINSRKALFYLGSMGPDIFFFSGMNPLNKSKEAMKLARKMHRKKTGEYLNSGVLYLKRLENDSEDFKDLLSYLIGFICHYSSDRMIHPYIFWGQLNNVYKTDGEKRSISHVEFEGTIDSILSNERLNKDAKSVKAYRYIKRKESLPDVIKSFLVNSAENIYSIKISKKEIQRAVNNTIMGLWLFNTSTGIKKTVLNSLLKLLGKGELEFHYSYEFDPNTDYLNINKRQWFNPVDKDEVHNKSFYDLFELGLEEGKNQIIEVLKVLEDNSINDEKISIFKDVGYDTNKPFDEKHQHILKP